MFNSRQRDFRRRKDSLGQQFKSLLGEVFLIFVIAFSAFLLLALITYHNSDPGWSRAVYPLHIQNLGGYVGAWLADFFFCIFGFAAYVLPFVLVFWVWLWRKLWRNKAVKERFSFILRSLNLILFLLVTSALCGLNLPFSYLPSGNGGIVGAELGGWCLKYLNLVGTNLLLAALFFASSTLFSGVSWLKLAEKLGVSLMWFADFLGRTILKVDWIGIGKNIFLLRFLDNKKQLSLGQNDGSCSLEAKPEMLAQDIDAHAPTISSPETIKISRRAATEKQLPLFEPELDGSLPPLSLLDLPEKSKFPAYTNAELTRMSQEVELRLREFDVAARVVAVHPGPVVTRFELELAAGTKVSKITTLVKDLARSLSVISVRVVEVIPGKSVIGLELPNQHREVVRLREILSSQQYEMAKAPLTLALGKDISGHPVIVDLAKMPHLLVAGTTGSGKSVCINALLLSILYKYTAKDVRLIMIDPKMLELSVYDGIPHLLVPVVTDMKDAANALRWCVYEMERRYRLLAALGVRNLSGYNHKIKEAREKGKPILDPLWRPEDPLMEDSAPELQELPYIVVVADEYADMIVVVGKKVEELIARIAQKARAAGIHLILATQRPSVDVITGLIKANIPTRIAFQVSSKIDSRTILDQSGAEQLLGAGDMLYLPPGSGVPIRIHGAFVADEEVHRAVRDLKRRGKPDYIEGILTGGAWAGGSENINNGSSFAFTEGEENFDAEAQDPLYDQAVRIVIDSRRASISNVQRRLRIGYNRAARIIESMEKAGVVSSMESNGNRTVLVAASQGE
ncbi:MAG: DNA translocase FtsK 4TM domain-containing protein [Gammaproteobacteria bacterium]